MTINSSKYPKTSVIQVFWYFEYRAVSRKILWAGMVIALSAESACVAVDVVELKIVVFRPLDGATFVSLYTLVLTILMGYPVHERILSQCVVEIRPQASHWKRDGQTERGWNLMSVVGPFVCLKE